MHGIMTFVCPMLGGGFADNRLLESTYLVSSILMDVCPPSNIKQAHLLICPENGVDKQISNSISNRHDILKENCPP